MDSELAYLAGFIDGEGCVAVGTNLAQSGNRRYLARLTACQVNPKPLRMLQQKFGGSIGKRKGFRNQRPVYEWRVVSDKAANALRALLPYLRGKADEARLLIEFQESLGSQNRSRSALSDAGKFMRRSYFYALGSLKHVDYESEGQLNG